MSSAGPRRLADGFWLAAYDSVNGKPWIGERPRGLGLATGLLAELVHGGFVELRQGELFRTAAQSPEDPALSPLLSKMEGEEQASPTAPYPAPMQTRGPEAVRRGHDWPPQSLHHQGWPPAARDRWDWPTQVQEERAWPPPVQDEMRHRRHGHQLGTWMSYLADERRAEDRVVVRLSRAGLVRWEERRRLIGTPMVRYIPTNSVVSGWPASTICGAVRRRQRLNRTQLFQAGLFLATGLHHHALSTLTPTEHEELGDEIKRGLDEASRELLIAADRAVGDAAMR